MAEERIQMSRVEFYVAMIALIVLASALAA